MKNPLNYGFSGERLFYALGLTALFLLTISGCSAKKESRDEVPKRDINAVMADHTAELMAIPGVTGVAIGETENKTPCILVLVEKQTAEIERVVPKTLEGHPVRILVTGKIVPMNGD